MQYEYPVRRRWRGFLLGVTEFTIMMIWLVGIWATVELAIRLLAR